MRKIVMILALLSGVMLSGCSSLFVSSSLGASDLYRTNNRVEVANRLKAEAEAQRAEAEAREALWAARQAEMEAERAEEAYYSSLNAPSYQSIIANDYESAYARRLYGFNSPTYRMPSSYYDLAYSRDLYYAKAYDPSLYNIMVSGDQVWVEPKYITSMFGSWGATNITFGIYASPWNYGWSYRVDPFYYSCWGYPHYSWYDWNWNICYNPWYYDTYWWHYYPHYHNHYYPHKPSAPRPPQHRPESRPESRPNHGYVTTGSGASSGTMVGNLNGGRGTTSSRYTSPTSDKNYGTTTVTRPTGRGTVSTGVNSNSQYRGSATVNTNRGTTTTSSGNFRQGTTTTSRGTQSTVNSSTTANKGTSTSSSRSTTSSSYRSGSSSSRSNFGSSSSSTRSYGGGTAGSSGGGNTSSRR